MSYYVWTPEEVGEGNIEIVAANQSQIAEIHADLIERATEASMGSSAFEEVTKQEIQELMAADPKKIPYRLVDPIFYDDEKIIDSEFGLSVGFWLGAFVGVKRYKIRDGDVEIKGLTDRHPELIGVIEKAGITHYGLQRKPSVDAGANAFDLDETHHISLGTVNDEGEYSPVLTFLGRS